MSDDRGWVESARQGDTSAWEALVQAHQQAVFRLAYLLLGDADDAEDVAQETFLRAYHAMDRFDPTRPLRPWLMRITTNLCHNWKRSVGRYLAALQHVLQREPPLNTHIQQAEEQLDSELLWRAVQRLPVEDQKVIYLRYFLDCSEMETAQVLGVAQGTVKSRQHRALARLRGVLEKEFPQGLKEGADVF